MQAELSGDIRAQRTHAFYLRNVDTAGVRLKLKGLVMQIVCAGSGNRRRAYAEK